jgi:hypothetical protein
MADDERVWESGDAWLFHMGVNHRGPAHTDRNAPHRVVLILTVAARPNVLSHDNHILSLGTSYSLKMEMSGQTMHNMEILTTDTTSGEGKKGFESL